MGIDAGPAIGGLASVATWIEEEQVPEIVCTNHFHRMHNQAADNPPPPDRQLP